MPPPNACTSTHMHKSLHTRAPARRHIRITDKSQRPPSHHADTRMTAHLLCLCMGKQAQGHLSERCGSFLNQGNLDSRESKKQVQVRVFLTSSLRWPHSPRPQRLPQVGVLGVSIYPFTTAKRRHISFLNRPSADRCFRQADRGGGGTVSPQSTQKGLLSQCVFS